jgi:hypothetical protein
MMAVDLNERPQQVSEVPAMFEAACKISAKAYSISDSAKTAEARAATPLPAQLAQPTLNDAPEVLPLPAARSGSFESRDARPVNYWNPMAPPAQNPPAPQMIEMAPPRMGFQPSLRNKHSRGKLIIITLPFVLAGLIALAMVGYLVGWAAYMRYKAAQMGQRTREAQARIQVQTKQLENQIQKDERIRSLRYKINNLLRRLQASNEPSLEKKRDVWNESLNKLSQRLYDIDKMSLDQLNETNQGFDEIGKEIDKIEEEVNSLQGLLLPFETDRDPVKV